MEPQMRAAEIADKVVEVIRGELFDVVIVNFANADMVAHTGNFAAGLVAIQTVDEQLGRIVKVVKVMSCHIVLLSFKNQH
jgi:2,3-bisphosphoglycerate-independent phosphoglycerate mutase